MFLKNYVSICDAMVLLMKPLIEIVIHDLQSNTICYINGGLSNRKIGDPSLLETDFDENLSTIVYPKLNFDGRLIKSTSIPIDQKWLICINCDLSVFNEINTLSTVLLNTQPKSLFQNDWQEKLHQSLHTFLNHHNLIFEHLTGAQKKTVVRHLYDSGAFSQRNASDYIANILNLGRATIFKYLKEWRQ